MKIKHDKWYKVQDHLPPANEIFLIRDSKSSFRGITKIQRRGESLAAKNYDEWALAPEIAVPFFENIFNNHHVEQAKMILGNIKGTGNA